MELNKNDFPDWDGIESNFKSGCFIVGLAMLIFWCFALYMLLIY